MFIITTIFVCVFWFGRACIAIMFFIIIIIYLFIYLFYYHQARQYKYFPIWCISDESTELSHLQLQQTHEQQQQQWILKAREGAEEIQLKRYSPAYNLPEAFKKK
jgi:hypothetical protein